MRQVGGTGGQGDSWGDRCVRQVGGRCVRQVGGQVCETGGGQVCETGGWDRGSGGQLGGQV